MKSARQEILDNLRITKLSEPEKPDFDAPVYHKIIEPLDEAFKDNLEKVNGSVFLCHSETELFEKLTGFLNSFDSSTICCKEPEIRNLLHNAQIEFNACESLPDNIQVGITSCEFLIAHTGSVMVSSAQKGGRQLFIYPPHHIVIARKNQLVDYLEKAYSGIQEKYKTELPSQIAIITGPSRTADIEKTLILGAHGPKELIVFIY